MCTRKKDQTWEKILAGWWEQAMAWFAPKAALTREWSWFRKWSQEEPREERTVVLKKEKMKVERESTFINKTHCVSFLQDIGSSCEDITPEGCVSGICNHHNRAVGWGTARDFSSLGLKVYLCPWTEEAFGKAPQVTAVRAVSWERLTYPSVNLSGFTAFETSSVQGFTGLLLQ